MFYSQGRLTGTADEGVDTYHSGTATFGLISCFQFNTNVNISEENIKVFYLQMLLIYFHILKWNEIPVNVNMLPGRFWHHTNLSSSYCFTWKTLVWTRIRQVKCSVCSHVVWEFSVITDVWKPLRSTQCSQMEYLQHAAILY